MGNSPGGRHRRRPQRAVVAQGSGAGGPRVRRHAARVGAHSAAARPVTVAYRPAHRRRAPARHRAAARSRWIAASALLVAFAAVELAVGAVERSAAIWADGLLTVAGAVGVLLALAARGDGSSLVTRHRRPWLDARMALTGGLTLAAIGLGSVATAVISFPAGDLPGGPQMLLIGVAGGAVNLLAAWLLGGTGSLLSVRAARAEEVSDLWGSVVVTVAGVLVPITGSRAWDSAAGVVIGCIMVGTAGGVIRGAVRELAGPKAAVRAGAINLRQARGWLRVVVVSVLIAQPWGITYVAQVVSGSLAMATGLPVETIVLLPAAAILLPAIVLLPLTKRLPALAPASLVVAGLALLAIPVLGGQGIGVAVAITVAVLVCPAQFTYWARFKAGLPNDRRGDVADQLMFGTLAAMFWLLMLVAAAGVGDPGPATAGRVAWLWGLYGAALLLAAPLLVWLVPRPTATSERAVWQTLTAPWKALRDPKLRPVVVMSLLSGGLLTMWDAGITAALIAAGLSQATSAGTGVALLVGGFAWPAIAVALRRWHKRLIVASVLTAASFPVGMIFGGTGVAAQALVPALIFGRILVEAGTNGQTNEGPNVRRGDPIAMAANLGGKYIGGFLGAAAVGVTLAAGGWRLNMATAFVVGGIPLLALAFRLRENRSAQMR